MKFASLTLLQPHHDRLKSLLFTSDGKERAAYLLCGKADIKADPWTGTRHDKFVSHKVVPVDQRDVVDHSSRHVSWKTGSFVRMLKEAQDNNLVVAIVHSHPTGLVGFSQQDDRNEPDLCQLAINRNGVGTQVLSLVFDSHGGITGRIWDDPKVCLPLSLIRVFGERFVLHYCGRGQGELAESLNRQALAFGDSLNEDLSQLRVGVVGCGATGSAVLSFLPRHGVRHIAVFDKDIVEESNLNRLHGATLADARAERLKVDVAERGVAELGLGGQVAKYPYWIDDPRCHDALKASDIVFGCTDDNAGRVILNRLPFYYGIPVIDIGLKFEVTDSVPPRMQLCDGRVSVVHPGTSCLLCSSVINLSLAREDFLKRVNPEEYARLRKEGEAYVIGEGNPAPAVGCFTTEVACMALSELIHRIQGFRGEGNEYAQRVRRFNKPGMGDRKQRETRRCNVCGSEEKWGLGDRNNFLGLVG